MLRVELEPIHDRLDRVEAEAPRGHQQDIPNRQQGGRVPWRNVEEEAESDFDEPYLNRGRFQRGNEHREARMGSLNEEMICAKPLLQRLIPQAPRSSSRLQDSR